MKPLPPGADQLWVGAQIPFVLLFAGAPECWQHQKHQQEQGLNNSIVLPDARQVHHYHWPINDCYLLVLLFHAIKAKDEAILMNVLCSYTPREVALRHWPGQDILIRRRSGHEG